MSVQWLIYELLIERQITFGIVMILVKREAIVLFRGYSTGVVTNSEFNKDDIDKSSL